MLIMSINGDGERSMTRLHEGASLRPSKKQAIFTPSLLPDLAYTPEVARETAHLYERVSRVIPPIEWPGFAPYVKAINELKRARNAVVLSHNYMTPAIFHCVADVVGLSGQRIAARISPDRGRRADHRRIFLIADQSARPHRPATPAGASGPSRATRQ